MLSEEVKTRVRAEEIFRAEIRNSLAAPKSPKDRLLERLNYPITLWLLSTIVVGAISWGYARFDEAQRKASEARAATRDLDSEIALRLEVINEKLNVRTPATVGELESAIGPASWTKNKAGGVPTLHPKYADIELRPLLLLAAMSASREEVSQLKAARDAASRLIELQRIRAQGDSYDSILRPDILRQARLEFKSMHLPRWQIDGVVNGSNENLGFGSDPPSGPATVTSRPGAPR